MGYSQVGITGVANAWSADSVLGILSQPPSATKSTQGTADASGDVMFGNPFVIGVTFGAAADGTVNVDVISKNSPWKFRIIDAVYYMRTHRSGGTPTHTLRLFHGDGAASESFNAISDQADVAAGASGVVDKPYRFGTLSDAYYEIAASKSLRVQLIVGGTTTTGAALGEVYIVGLRTN